MSAYRVCIEIFPYAPLFLILRKTESVVNLQSFSVYQLGNWHPTPLKREPVILQGVPNYNRQVFPCAF